MRDKTWLIVGIVGIVLVIAIFSVFSYLYNKSSCEHCFSITGFLNEIKSDGSLVIDNETQFVSDWFYPDGHMPLWVNGFVGHVVRVDFVSGCGRVMVVDIKVVR